MYQRPNPVELDPAEPRAAPLWRRAIAGLLKALLAIGIVAGGLWLARDIYTSAPTAERVPPEREPRLVAVAPVRPAERGPRLAAWGSVEAVRRLALRPEIGGRVDWHAPALVPGGRVAAGDPLVRLDDRDARLEIAEAEAEIARLDAQIRIEGGQQQRAERDLERSPVRSGITEEQRALILREPQMAELEAQRAAAVARRDAARLRAAKMALDAPFDALVVSEEIASGGVVMAGAELARLVAIETYRVRLAVPPSALVWLDPEAGQSARITQPGVWPEGAERTGRVAGIDADLSETGRMAEVIVEVDDPLGGAGPRLLLGAFVRAEIAAPALPGAVAIDRAWLRDGDTVWVMGADGRLEIRRPEIAWRGGEEVLVTAGVAPGERVVTTDLAIVSEGMALRTEDAAE